MLGVLSHLLIWSKRIFPIIAATSTTTVTQRFSLLNALTAAILFCVTNRYTLERRIFYMTRCITILRIHSVMNFNRFYIFISQTFYIRTLFFFCAILPSDDKLYSISLTTMTTVDPLHFSATYFECSVESICSEALHFRFSLENYLWWPPLKNYKWNL